MFNAGSRRRAACSRSTMTHGRFAAGNKNYFTPVNQISSNIPQYTQTINTVTIYQPAPVEPVDCTAITNEYNLLKNELTSLKNLFSNTGTTIDDVLSGLS